MEAINLKKLRKNLFSMPSTGKVSRSLFGEVDHEEVKKDLEREFRETLQEKSKLWNFDFDKYCPRNETTNSLHWTTCPCPITETLIAEERNLVTQFKDNLTTTYTKTTVRKEEKDVQENTNSPVRNRINSILNTDDDSPAIEIINESPIRSLTPPEPPISIEKSRVKLDITSTLTRRKRKRSSTQATIDDFMKKKKPRVNMEFSSIKKASPVSTRLRSSPSKVQVKV